jgi:hypothetical protein
LDPFRQGPASVRSRQLMGFEEDRSATYGERGLMPRG